jgi:hypothetical protein
MKCKGHSSSFCANSVLCAEEGVSDHYSAKRERYTSRQLRVAASVAIVCNKGRPYRPIIVFVDRDDFHCAK